MKISIQHTHYLDRLMRVIAFLLTFVVPIFITYWLLTWLQMIEVESPGFLALAIIIGLFVLTIWLRDSKIMNDNGPFDAFSAFLYIRLGLGVRVSLSEANRISSLFVPNHTGTWWPMKNLKKIPREYRKAEFALAAQDVMNKYFDLHFKFYELS